MMILLRLYTLLFAWLTEHINQRLCRDDLDTFIGLFDLPGRPNSFNQFCINLVNECLHHFIQCCLFKAHVDKYKSEGIALLVPPIPYFDNSECIRLLHNRPGGLIHIMDDQACQSHKKMDYSMTEAFGKKWGNHLLCKLGAMDQSGFVTFTVNHFNGPVTYSLEGFLERNLNALNLESVAPVWGTSSTPSNAH